MRALSSAYVERRRTLGEGGALSSAGKRAAFALFYGPLHYLLVQRIVAELPGAAAEDIRMLVDLGCGTGAAGAAWANACGRTPPIEAIDRYPWALREAAETCRAFGIPVRTRRQDLEAVRFPHGTLGILAAFSVNELARSARAAILARLLARAERGDRVLIVEPLAGFVAPWWGEWRNSIEQRGGRADEWRFQVDLPPIVAKLDRAAGLHHDELTGRSLWLAG